jgi:uncharacterized membrane protein YbhN (UPF0104 family)
MSSLTATRIRQLLITLVVGGACLWFAFRGVVDGASGQDLSIESLTETIAAVPFESIAIFLALFGVQVLLRTERWRIQVHGLTGTTPSWRDALTINLLAFAAVFFLPFRLGEFLRPNLCARRGIMSAPAGLAATALERIIDGLVATAMFGILLVVAPFEWPAWVRAGGVSALAFFGGGIIALIIAMKSRDLTLRLVDRIVGRVSATLAARISGLLASFLDGLRCFNGPKAIFQYVMLSVVFWALNGVGTAVVVRGVDPGASYAAGFVCLCFLVIGVMLPAPPGNVGNFHAFAKLGLTLSGVAPLPAVAAAVLLHALNTLVVLTGGILGLAFGSIRVSDARKALDSPQATPATTEQPGQPVQP